MPSDDPAYDKYKVEVYSGLFIGMIYGAYTLIYITSVYVLLSKPGFTSSSPRISMFGVTTVMFLLGIIALVLETSLKLRTFSTIYPSRPIKIGNYVWGAITSVMYILCDLVCAWRTVVIWNRDKRIIAILSLFILGTIAAAGFALPTRLGANILPGESNEQLGKLDLIMTGPSLATNLLSTTLIACKAWQRRIPVREHLRKGSRSVRFERVFALLIESGLIYCCIWILYWISTFGVFIDPGFTAMVCVSGLYPTLIIILISKQMSPIEQYATDFTDSIDPEMQFAHVPTLGPPRDGGPSLPP